MWFDKYESVKKCNTAEEAIVAAGLDWELEKRQATFSDGELSIEIPGKFAVAKKGKGTFETIGTPSGVVVGNDYRILQNIKAFEFFDGIVAGGLAKYHTAGSFANNSIVWILAELEPFVIGKSDEIESYVLLINKHDGKAKVRIQFTPIRVVCGNILNSMLIGGKNEIFSLTHTKRLYRELPNKNGIIQEELFKRVDSIKLSLLNFTKKKLQEKSAKLYFETVVKSVGMTRETTRQKKTINRLMELFYGSPGADLFPASLYSAYNAVTYYSDHERPVRGEIENPIYRSESMVTGNGANMKAIAFEFAESFLNFKGV